MSPSENDLRAALRDGAGDDTPDVDALLAHVRDRRAQRRTRVLSAAAAVVIVAAAAVGGAALWGGSSGNGEHDTGKRNGPALGPVPQSVAAIGIGCPTSYPVRSVPALGAGSGPMFSGQVARVLVCSYDEARSAPARSSSHIELDGSDATALTESIEQASTTRLRVMCPDIVSADKKMLAIIGVTAAGSALPAVTTDVSIPNCNQPITNGTAVRYAWKPPAAVSARIASLTTNTARPRPVNGAGTMNGTPVR